MKIALLGNGKTGKYVKLIHPNTQVFDSKNILTSQKIQDCDIIICFVSGDVFIKYIDILLESKKPVVIASTGFQWPDNIEKELQENRVTWIYSSNFSKGLFVYKSLIEVLKTKVDLLDTTKMNIHDIHHSQKLDSPSGTAISINEWFDGKATITSQRVGDTVGFHELSIETEDEEIKISHNAKSRKVFAQGAVKACELIMQGKMQPGLKGFYEVL